MQTINVNSLRVLALAAAAAFSAGAPIARAQTTNRQVVLNPGTVIPVNLGTELSSNQSQVGDTFTANVDDSKQAYRSILSGATVQGVVRSATPQSGSDPGTLSLAFTRLTLSDGRTIAISGVPTSLDTKNLSTRSDGVLVAKTVKKDNTLTYAGIGAGAGILVDVLKGGKLRLEDILIGGGLGAAAAQVLKSQPQVHDVDLPSGTAMGVLLNTTTRYYHRAAKVITTKRTVVKRTHRAY